MKTLLVLAVLLAAAPVRAAYFSTLFADPAHPKVSASALYTSKMDFDGAESDVAVIFHKADPHDTILPQALLDAGIKPISWTLLEVGAGGDRQTGFASIGPGVYVAQTLLGPVAQMLKQAGGNYATAGNLLVSENGGGVRLGLHWKANALQNGGLARFNELRFAPRYVLGYAYQF